MSGPAAAYIAVLRLAQERRIRMNRTKVAKLLYLADLECMRTASAPSSGINWRWRHYGPYSDTLVELERDLSKTGLLATTATHNYYGTPEYLLQAEVDTPLNIDTNYLVILEKVVRELGPQSAAALRDLTYDTAPMRAAQQAGAREVDLDLGLVTAPSAAGRMAAMRTRLQTQSNGLPSIDAAEYATTSTQLADTVEDNEDLLRRANSALLG